MGKKKRKYLSWAIVAVGIALVFVSSKIGIFEIYRLSVREIVVYGFLFLVLWNLSEALAWLKSDE